MTEAAQTCPEVTGRWPGYWIFESDVAAVDELPPIEGVLSILLQDGPQFRGEVTTESEDASLCIRLPILGTLDNDGTTSLRIGEEPDGTFEPQTLDWVFVSESESAGCEFAGDRVELRLRYRLMPRHSGVEPRSGGRATLRFLGCNARGVMVLEDRRAHVTEFGRICERLRQDGEEPTLGRVFDEMFGRQDNPPRASWSTSGA